MATTERMGVDPLADKWPVRVHPVGHGQWAFVAGPRSGTGYRSKAEAQEAGEAARRAALATVHGGSAEVAELLACKQFLEDMHTQSVEWTVAESQVRYQAVCAVLAKATGASE